MENDNNINILIAEDAKFNQLVIERIMQELKYSYKIVENGQLAVDESLKMTYDIIIMDIEMPILNGSEATKIIRSNNTNPNYLTPILGFTSHINPKVLDEFLKIGMNSIITKPFSKESITIACNKYLNLDDKSENNSNNNTNFNADTTIGYNLSYLEEFTGGDEKFMKEMLSYFAKNTPTMISKMKDSISNSKWEELTFLAHKYSSEISFVGVNSISVNLDEIENYDYLNVNINYINQLVHKVETEAIQVVNNIKTDFNI